eukprot:g2586.t1
MSNNRSISERYEMLRDRPYSRTSTRLIGALMLCTIGCFPKNTLAKVNYADPDSVIRSVKHKMGSAKAHARVGSIQKATNALDEAGEILKNWSRRLKNEGNDSKKSNEESGHDVAESKDVRVSNETFRFVRTSVPERCEKTASKNGDYLKIHFVGWVWPDKKMIASSFHTGSMPVKVVLGDSNLDKVAGVSLSEGLRDACRKERRDIFVPASMAFGSEGNAKMKIPPNADLKFSVEIADIGRSIESNRRRPGASGEL